MLTELLELFEPLFSILATSILFIGGVALAIYGLVLVCKGLKLLFKKTINNMSLCADCIKNWIDSGFERLENTIKSAIKSANHSQTEDILQLVQPMVEKMVEENMKEQFSPCDVPVAIIDKTSELQGLWEDDSHTIHATIYREGGTYIMSLDGIEDHYLVGKYLLSEESENNRFYANGCFGFTFHFDEVNNAIFIPRLGVWLKRETHNGIFDNEAFTSVEKLSLDDDTRERIKVILSDRNE